MDNDATVLKEASAAVTQIDLKYRRADTNAQLKMKADRDKAFSAYAAARRKLLAAGVICTDKDVEKMRSLRDEVRKARETQSLLIAAARLASFLVAL